jgi:hypothetical protein
VKALRATASWWVVVIGIIAVGSLVYSIGFVGQSGIARGQALLPTPRCYPEHTSTTLPQRYSSANDFIFFYTLSGCQSLVTGSNTVATDDAIFETAEQQLEGVGLRPVRTPVTIDALAVYPPQLRIYPATPGYPGGMVFNAVSSDPALLAIEGLTRLSLADTSPGLVGQDLTSAVDTVVWLGQPQRVTQARQAQRQGIFQPGLFDAWLISNPHYGPALLHDILVRCSVRCSWSSARDQAIRARGGRLQTLERVYAARATTPDHQSQLIKQLTAE